MRLVATALAGWIAAVPVGAQDLLTQPSFSAAATAVRDGNFNAVEELTPSGDPLVSDLVSWLQYRGQTGTADDAADLGAFPKMAAFASNRSDWPGLSRLRANTERAINAETTAAQIIAFFDGHDVETGQGAVALANALIGAGQQTKAEAMLIDLWLTSGLTDDGHLAIVNAFPDVIAPYHSARADMLLWRWRTSDASNLLPLLDEGQQALVRARMAIIDKDDDIRAREDLVPDRLRDVAGLHYDRFNWFAGRGDWTQASVVLNERSQSAELLGVPWRWGSWRRILARWHMREGNIDTAYRTASDHFIASGENNFADLEWLSGYIALTYLRDFDRALTHFERFDAAVTSPISKGRAGYWLGRAHEGRGDAPAAVTSFQAGALHQTSFYGLLSAERLGLTMDPDLIGRENFSAWRSSQILTHDFVRAGLLLLDAGERGAAVQFFAAVAKDLPRQQVGQLGAMLMEIDEPFYAVLVAKTAVRSGIIVQDAYFPIHPMAQMDLPVEPALALAIARQESEFRVDAGSSVGALGMMQLMPATAQDVAGWLDVPYNRARLTGRIAPVRFTDTLIGAAPLVRPNLRPIGLGGPTVRPVARATD